MVGSLAQKASIFKSYYGSAAVLVLAILGIRAAALAIEVPLDNTLQDFVTLTLSIFIEAFPFVVLGSLLAAGVNTFVPPDTIQRILPKRDNLRRALLSVMGFMFPVCECGNVPLSRALMIQGLKPADALTFLLAAPVLNPVTIWATWVAFSYDSSIVVSRVVATLVIANLIGFVVAQYKKPNALLTKDFERVCTHRPSAHETEAHSSKTRKLSSLFTTEAYAMLRMLAFGALIAGTVQTFVPREVLLSIGSNVILSILAMLLLAFVVSICANVDAFFALSFANTFTAGSIVSFLVFGPMIDIKMLTLLKTTFRTHLLVIVSGLAFILSLLTGLVVTYAF